MNNGRGETGERIESHIVTLQWCSPDQSKTTTLTHIIACAAHAIHMLFQKKAKNFVDKPVRMLISIKVFVTKVVVLKMDAFWG